MTTFPHERPKPEHGVGDFLIERYNDVQGECVKVEWAPGFGTWAYLIKRSATSRYGGKVGGEVWVYQGYFLKRI